MNNWFNLDGLTPHGYCLSWDPQLMIAFVFSNGAIAVSYLIISLVLAGAAVGKDPAMPRWLYWMFAAFIFCCAVSHVLDDVTLFVPIYRWQALELAITAMVSAIAAIMPLSLWLAREAHRWRR